MIVAVMIAFYEQQQVDKNVYVLAIAIGVFMFGMMQLCTKAPSENQEKEEENVQ